MESLILVIEFFVVKGVRSILFYFIVPILLGVVIYYQSDNAYYLKNAVALHSNLVTVLGVLIGFTISTFTMLLTVSNSNVRKAKLHSLEKEIFGNKLSLYDSVLIGLAYTILVQGFLLIGNFVYPLFIPLDGLLGKLLLSINISFMVHIILILMQNILHFYFILTRKR